MKNIPKISVFVLFTALLLNFGPATHAQDSSESGSINEVTENLKTRLKETVEGVNLEELASSPRAYVGVVRDIIKDTIVIEDKSGKKNIMVDDTTSIIRSPGNAEIELDSVRIEDYIIAMGYKAEEDELSGKRLIVSATPFSPPKKLSGLGTIESIDKYSFDINTADSEENLELFFTKNTIYKSPESSLDFEDVSVGDQVLYTAIIDKDGDWSATIVMQIKPAN